jgi:hypothetical protein
MKSQGKRKKVKGKSVEAVATVCLLAFAFLLADGCGNVQPPVAPENIGLAAKLKREQLKREEQAKKEQEKAAQEQRERELSMPEAELPVEEEALPELRPIGTPR